MAEGLEHKDAYVKEDHGVRTVSSADKREDGTIELSVSESMKGSNTVKFEHIAVEANGEVHVSSTVSVMHPELNRMTRSGMIIQAMPDTQGSYGEAADPKLAEAVRNAYEGFKNHDINSKDAGKIHQIIDQGLQSVPQQQFNNNPLGRL